MCDGWVMDDGVMDEDGRMWSGEAMKEIGRTNRWNPERRSQRREEQKKIEESGRQERGN